MLLEFLLGLLLCYFALLLVALFGFSDCLLWIVMDALSWVPVTCCVYLLIGLCAAGAVLFAVWLLAVCLFVYCGGLLTFVVCCLCC